MLAGGLLADLKAVVFDFGMVLSGPADVDAHRTLKRIVGVPEAIFESQYWAHRHAYDAGSCDGPEYWQRLARGAGVTLSNAQIIELVNNDVKMWSTLDVPMVQWALKVKASGFTTGILSNICFELSAAFEEQCMWLNQIDYRFWSSRLGVAKPDPAIYEHMLCTLGIRPEQILFIDDREDNIRAAQALGVMGILFSDATALDKQLGELRLREKLPRLSTSEIAKTPIAFSECSVFLRT